MTDTNQPELGHDTIDTILAWVDGDTDRATKALKAEHNNKARATLIDKLGRIVANDVRLARWARDRQVVDSKARFQIANGNVDLLKATSAYNQVTDIIENGEAGTRSVRLDSADPTVFTRLADAFYAAATEFTTMGDIKSMLSLAKMAEVQAETAERVVDLDDLEPPADLVDDEEAA